MAHPIHREVHFWTPDLAQPPCDTLEDGFEWSDAVEDVTCEACLEALAGDAGDLTPGRTGRQADDLEHPAP